MCALGTGVQTWALPICHVRDGRRRLRLGNREQARHGAPRIARRGGEAFEDGVQGLRVHAASTGAGWISGADPGLYCRARDVLSSRIARGPCMGNADTFAFSVKAMTTDLHLLPALTPIHPSTGP